MATAFLPTDMLTDIEAAELLGVRPQTLRVWRTVQRYRLPFVRVGRSVRYRRCDIEEFIQRRTVVPTGTCE